MIEKLRMFCMKKAEGHPIAVPSRRGPPRLPGGPRDAAGTMAAPKTLNFSGNRGVARLLPLGRQRLRHTRRIQPVVTKLHPIRRPEQQYRHEIPEARLEAGVRIDIDFGDARASRGGERLQRRPHLVAEMAVRADEERELDYSPLPSFSVV